MHVLSKPHGLLCAIAELSRLGAQTAMVAAAGHVCIGGAAGGVTCIPQASLRRGSVEGAFELRDAGGVGRLLTSLFARWASFLRWLSSCITCGVQRHSMHAPA
jgi:hypothetical protein